MIEYQQDLPPGWTEKTRQRVEAHVRAELSAIADADDDPDTNADDVDIITTQLDDGGLRIKGFLDAEPDAPYLMPDYDAWAGVDPELFACEVAAAQHDEERTRG